MIGVTNYSNVQEGTSAMIFIVNKYTRWYYNIITNAQARTLPKEIYTEKHHIIPKSLGGSNKKDNLVALTAREHFVCHWLLTKMATGLVKQKMVYGLWRMAVPVNNRHRITSSQYTKIREEFCKENSKRHKGKALSESCKKLKSEKQLGELNHFYGKTHTNDVKRLIGSKNRGRKHTEEELVKMKNSHLGTKNHNVKLTEDQVKEIRVSRSTTLQLAKEYNVSRSLIYKVLNRTAWPHISD